MSGEASTLVTLRPEGDRPPLYCVHPASGSVYCYSGLARMLGPGQPVHGLEAPGLDGECPPAASVDELVTTHLAAILPVVSGTAVSLLGWSMGGVVVFELAHRLRAAGVDVANLILVDCPVPCWTELPPEEEILRRFLMETAGTDDVSTEQVTELSELLATREPLITDDDDAAELTMMRHRYAVFRANTAALVRHRLTRHYPGPIQLIHGDRSQVEHMRWDAWADQVTTYVLPGDHMSIWAGDSLRRLTETVAEILAKGAGKPGPDPGP